jgi:hypothetical protein
VNTAGWLLLTAIFGGLLLVVQRAEQKRRNVTFAILAIVGAIVWGYANYRMSNDCTQTLKTVCVTLLVKAPAAVIARNTISAAVITSLVLNLLFWVLFGRYNPPGTSDSIQVFGMDD